MTKDKKKKECLSNKSIYSDKMTETLSMCLSFMCLVSSPCGWSLLYNFMSLVTLSNIWFCFFLLSLCFHCDIHSHFLFLCVMSLQDTGSCREPWSLIPCGPYQHFSNFPVSYRSFTQAHQVVDLLPSTIFLALDISHES